MYRLRYIAIDVLTAAAVMLPLLAILWKAAYHNAAKTLVHGMFALYLAAVWSAVGMPSVWSVDFDPALNFVPFVDMVSDFKNAMLNVVLFVPLGLLLPLLWKRYRGLKRTVLFGFGMSLSIEVLQLFTFRTTDINDLITNVTGTVLGYLLARWLLPKVPARWKPGENGRELAGIMGMTALVMGVIQPLLASALWAAIL